MPIKQYESCCCMSEKLWQNPRESYHVCFKNEVTHTCQILTMCAHYQIWFHRSSNLIFAVNMPSHHFFLMFTRHAQQMKNMFAAAYSTETTVWCIWMLYSCLATWSWETFSCSLDGICSASWRGASKQSKFHIHKAELIALTHYTFSLLVSTLIPVLSHTFSWKRLRDHNWMLLAHRS